MAVKFKQSSTFIIFSRPFHETANRKVLFWNEDPKKDLVFKAEIQISNPKGQEYTIIPSTGRVEPNKSIRLTLTRHAMTEDPGPCTDLFKLKSCLVAPTTKIKDLDSYWEGKRKSSSEVHVQRLRLTWLQDPNSEAGNAVKVKPESAIIIPTNARIHAIPSGGFEIHNPRSNVILYRFGFTFTGRTQGMVRPSDTREFQVRCRAGTFLTPLDKLVILTAELPSGVDVSQLTQGIKPISDVWLHEKNLGVTHHTLRVVKGQVQKESRIEDEEAELLMDCSEEEELGELDIHDDNIDFSLTRDSQNEGMIMTLYRAGYKILPNN
ncbi:uncharacterized protein BT62DRAFT_1009577 [Guyanagaster necrorhizus]|uniref:MSP domain-containing protein n=1 Tax=Guyanagaster necrorhizus TaxID=856835 RepID=A0A9P7VN53_9AGAR|nr:uncharacterized protein BT62DRAFT_1009577 [Guyanagaster necrorhizus MCA 3950]KAG7442976.1 hypothetical protein BT62DRAFT_1009577 [Guyanagaster necrorhizus MCA 3950]